jgi:GNAT superfamily N-acetyltransferase
MNMSSLQIVPATEAEIPVILGMIRDLAEYEKLTHLVVATEERLRQTLFGKRPAADVLLASWDSEWAGIALFFSNYSTFLAQPGIYLEDLYVKPHLRGKGIGFALLKRLTEIAVERGCGRVEWEVLDWNEPSIQFYKRLGAAPMDQWTRFRLTGDAIKQLAGSSSRHQS